MFGVLVVAWLALLFLTAGASAQRLDLQLSKIARRPQGVQRPPDEARAEQEAQRATRPVLEEEQRARVLEAERQIEQRLDRESILRDVRQQQSLQRALSGRGR